MRMSMKIVLSFSVLIVFAILILIVSLFNLQRLNGMVHQVAAVSAPRVVVSGEMIRILNENELAQRNILLLTRQSDRETIAKSMNDIDARMRQSINKLSNFMPPESQNEIDALRTAWNEVIGSNQQIAKLALQNSADQARTLTLGESSQAFSECIDALNEITDLLTKSSAFAARPTLERANAVRSSIYSLQNIEKDAVLQVDQTQIDSLVEKASALMARLDPEVEFLAKDERLPQGIKDRCLRFGEFYTKVKTTCAATLAKAQLNEDQHAFILAESTGKERGMRVRTLISGIADAAERDFQDQTRLSEAVFRSAVFWQLFISGVGLIASIALVGLVIRKVIKNLTSIIAMLTHSAGQVNYAANAISDSSSHLADGARSQAGQLRDTAATLENMAAMTRRNADTANATNATTGATVKLVESGSEAVRDMSSAMTDINEQSERIRAIIKTIEEIAFQTNLLALNAAVEAARAGEAGKGFAVVADEVRNLVQRSAQAARDTSELIVGTVDKVKNGASIAARLADSFKTIETGACQFQQHIQEITSASDEQAHSVEQINENIAQIDRSTYENANYAEQSSAASRDLKTQADLLSDIVDNLNYLVHGANSPVLETPTVRKQEQPRSLPACADSFSEKRNAAAESPKQAVMTPETVIPLDDDF